MATKKIRSKYTKSEMTCITMFYLLKDKKLHISTFVDKFELNDKQKMYKIITIIKKLLFLPHRRKAVRTKRC